MLLLALVALLPLAQTATYSDDFTRKQIFPLAAAAYSDSPQSCLTKTFGDGKVQRSLSAKCSTLAPDVCAGYTAVIPSQKAIIISYRGNKGFLQMISAADSALASQMAWIAGGKVASYFGNAFTTLWNKGMKDDFLTLRNANPTYEVWITGHSLGGALASLAASYVVASGVVPSSQVKLITYGQPRTGDRNFANAHDSQMDYSFRVTHWRDIVPHVPNEDFEGYYHHKFEVFYKEDMAPNTQTVCAEDEDSNCSDGLLVTTSFDDNNHYFSQTVSDFGQNGC